MKTNTQTKAQFSNTTKGDVECPNEDFIQLKKELQKNEIDHKYKNKGTHFELNNDGSFLKRLRLNLGITRVQAKALVQLSEASIKRYENGSLAVSPEKLDRFLKAYCINHSEFLNFKLGKATKFSSPICANKPNIIEHKELRRSYKTIITPETKALTHLRKIKGVSQYELCRRCGWSLSAICHIERGRIELTEKKLKHILDALGFTMKKFKSYLNSPIDRNLIEAECIQLIMNLDNEKLQSAKTILKNFN